MSKGPYVGMFRQAAGAWIGLIAAWSIVALFGLFWLAGGIASWLMGQGLSAPPFGFEFGEALIVDGPSSLWPDVPLALIVGVFVAQLALLLLPAAVIAVNVWRRRVGEGDPTRSMAELDDLRDMAPDGVRERALKLRPAYAATLTPRERNDFPLHEAGVPLGALQPRGTELRASWEDVALAIMAPRSGKTTAEAIPALLDAPGAAVITSNKADVWLATAPLRADKLHDGIPDEDKRQAWLFDPQKITPEPPGRNPRDGKKSDQRQTWWWDPLKNVDDFESALRLASHFMQEVDSGDGGGDNAFWLSSAADVLTSLFLAAALKPGGHLLDVYIWLNDPGNTEPVEILRAHGDEAAGSSLEARQTSAPETREGIFEFARTACRCLRNKHIVKWVVPPGTDLDGVAGPNDPDSGAFTPEEAARIRQFHPEDFVRSRDTIYLLSKDGAAAAAPLVAALTDQILVAATKHAEQQHRGRLDPPMVVVLDEAANICKIPDLPLLYSHLGSRGIFVMTILQSRPQARQVWGRDGFETMWSAATVKLIGAGIDDPELAADVSQLVGEHDISIRSVSTGDSGSFSESVSLRKELIMSPSAVRAMPKGSAILLATGARPASIRLRPWYDSPRKEDVEWALNNPNWPNQPSADELVTVSPRRAEPDIDLTKSDRPPPPSASSSPAPWPAAPAERTSTRTLPPPPASAQALPPPPATPAPAEDATAETPLPYPGPTATATMDRGDDATGQDVPVVSQDGDRLGTARFDPQDGDAGALPASRGIRKRFRR